MAKKAEAKSGGIEKGDAVKVIGGAHKGKTGEVEHIRAATNTATVRIENQPHGIALADLEKA